MHIIRLDVGLVYKKGKFSATEDAQVHAAITQYAAVCLWYTNLPSATLVLTLADLADQ
jgi:hypothetical protein